MEHSYAVIATGGKQYRVKVGQRCKFEQLAGEPGSTVAFDKVLLVANGEDIQVGAPYVQGTQVKAEIVEHGRAKKITVIRFKRRKKYRRKLGHRQYFTEVRITGIDAA
jgi:large subunit ribosomal protein L21